MSVQTTRSAYRLQNVRGQVSVIGPDVNETPRTQDRIGNTLQARGQLGLIHQMPAPHIESSLIFLFKYLIIVYFLKAEPIAPDPPSVIPSI